MSEICIDLSKKTSEGVGGKAQSLSKLMEYGVPVPKAMGISTSAFYQFLQHNNLLNIINLIKVRIDYTKPAAIKKASDEIAGLVMAAEIPENILNEISDSFSKMQFSGNVIVRSSALGEDSIDASFAGQLDSFECDDKFENVRLCILKCFASFWSERSLFYQNARNTTLQGMGVVIQEYVKAKYSGVLFTRDPNPSDYVTGLEEMVGEYCFGAGKHLVSGEITPGRFKIKRNFDEITLLSRPEQDSTASNAPKEILMEIAKLSLSIEKKTGLPQDIEWVVDDFGRLFFVQSRPITTVSASTVHWTNVNLNENYPNPVCTMLYSIALRSYAHYFREIGIHFGVSTDRLHKMENHFKSIIGLHAGRIYYNLTSIYNCISLVPYGKKLVEYFDIFVGVRSDSGQSEVRRLKNNPIEVVRIIFSALRALLKTPGHLSRFEKTVESGFDWNRSEKNSEIHFESAAREYENFLHIRFNEWKYASLSDLSAMISYGRLKNYFESNIEKKFPEITHNSMLKGISDVISSKPTEALWEIAELIFKNQQAFDLLITTKSNEEIWNNLTAKSEFTLIRKAIENYMHVWGFRCSGELLLIQPNLQESPLQVIGLIKGYLVVKRESPRAILTRQGYEQKALLNKLLQKFSTNPFKMLKIWFFVAWARRAITWRERARHQQARLYGRLRHNLLVIGKNLKEKNILFERDDVFYLTHDELTRLLLGTEVSVTLLKELAHKRCVESKSFEGLPVPDHFQSYAGIYPDIGKLTHDSKQTDNVVVKDGRYPGTGACGGSYKGRCVVLESVFESEKIEQGDVLITRQTDPGWAPVFPLISALVIERGGMLSHGAIVAREFGIPAVVGVKNATTILKTGQIIEVNGDKGYVEVIR